MQMGKMNPKLKIQIQKQKNKQINKNKMKPSKMVMKKGN